MNNDPVFDGLTEGFRAGFDAAQDAQSKERARIVVAIERQADALELIATLFGSCIGLGHTSCAPRMIPGTWTGSDVNFLRTGDGNKSFGCDRPSESDDDD